MTRAEHLTTARRRAWRGWLCAALCAGICFLIGGPAVADSAVWSTHGPYGVGAHALLAVAPNTLYAGTAFGGVFKSTDGGETWDASNVNLSSINIFALAGDPTAPNTLYAASVLDGVFKSTNGGSTWSQTGSAPIGYALALDPAAPATLYVGTINGVFKTVDGGGTWTASGLADVNVSVLILDPSMPDTVYAGAPFNGVFKSVDGGATWVATGLHPGAFALALDSRTPPTLYAGTAEGVAASTDGGDTWNVIGPDPHAVVYALAVDRAQPGTVYAGASYADGSNVGGVFVTANDGASWNPLNDGLTNDAVGGLLIDSNVPGRLYAATGGGVFVMQRTTSPTGLCVGGGSIAVTDLVTLVNIALGIVEPPACLAIAEPIDITTIVAAVERVLSSDSVH